MPNENSLMDSDHHQHANQDDDLGGGAGKMEAAKDGLGDEDDEAADEDDGGDSQEGGSGQEEELSPKCFTFSADMLAGLGQIEDLTSNCVDMQGLSFEAAVELIRPPQPLIRPKLPPHPTSKMKHNFSLPSVVIHSASSASNTPKKKKRLKKEAEAAAVKKATRSQSFHVASRPIFLPRLKLQLPEDSDDQPQEDDQQTSVKNGLGLETEPSSAEAAVLVTADEQQQQPKKRKRRKSLVNLFFPKHEDKAGAGENNKGAGENNTSCALLTATPPPDRDGHHHGGQRLHFRRLSDIICRVSSKNKTQQQSEVKSKDDCDLLIQQQQQQQPQQSAEAANFFRQLFPYRRRRSSVTHLDNTKQFHETKEEYLEATRRRMSSFPPMDGDESTIILEKIHYLITLEGDEATRAATPVSASMSPMRLFKKNQLIMPRSAAGDKWKSSTDIPSSKPASAVEAATEAVSCTSSPSNKAAAFLAPSLPYTPRRGSSPLVVELNALREADQRDKRAKERPGVVVFPKRKMEDVPGIFIPKNNNDNPANLGSRISSFLGVRADDSRRRHSVSDPLLLQQQMSAVQIKPVSWSPAIDKMILRTQYASTQAVPTSSSIQRFF